MSDAALSARREARWREEAAFFDREAQGVDEAVLPIDPLALRRYSQEFPKRRFSKEFRFRLLGSLVGRRVLDVGCGDGLNAVMFAKLGAHVTGVDISASALEVARRRAEVNGVAHRLSLHCAPIEEAPLPDDFFDIVWGDGILHHVLDDLEVVLGNLVRKARPGALFLFSEPINLCEPLRRLRRLVPVTTDATPGERPLVRPELDLVRRYIPDLQVRPYALLGRLDRFVLVRFNYERSPRLRRWIASALALLDYGLLSLPILRILAGTTVLYGHPSKAGSAVPETTASRVA